MSKSKANKTQRVAVLAEAIAAGCENDEEITQYLAAVIVELRGENAHREVQRAKERAQKLGKKNKSDRVFDQAMALAGAKRCPHCNKWLTANGGGYTGPR